MSLLLFFLPAAIELLSRQQPAPVYKGEILVQSETSGADDDVITKPILYPADRPVAMARAVTASLRSLRTGVISDQILTQLVEGTPFKSGVAEIDISTIKLYNTDRVPKLPENRKYCVSFDFGYSFSGGKVDFSVSPKLFESAYRGERYKYAGYDGSFFANLLIKSVEDRLKSFLFTQEEVLDASKVRAFLSSGDPYARLLWQRLPASFRNRVKNQEASPLKRTIADALNYLQYSASPLYVAKIDSRIDDMYSSIPTNVRRSYRLTVFNHHVLDIVLAGNVRHNELFYETYD